jgi:hypothetical protein
MRNRAIAFALLAVACLVGVGVAVAMMVTGAEADRAAARKAIEQARPRAEQVLGGDRPFVVYRQADPGRAQSFGRLSVARVGRDAVEAGVPAGDACKRVAFGAGVGLCLDGLGTSMTVKVLDAGLRTTHSLELAGIPSRARISPDGRFGGVTAFVVGHAYAAPGDFSTATTIIDLRAGKAVADLERDFTVTDGGKRIDARERNFWGLTFSADGDTFYATLAVGADTWLIKGSIRRRTAHTVHENVECPSLSPDETRIAYKKAVSWNPTSWRFHVLDLATGKETALAETRSVDDQLAWLDDDRLLYGDGRNTWSVAADGSGEPRLWMAGADSPTIQRGRQAAS